MGGEQMSGKVVANAGKGRLPEGGRTVAARLQQCESRRTALVRRSGDYLSSF
jgi:hypothetical protein